MRVIINKIEIFAFILFISQTVFPQPAEWVSKGIGGGGAFFSPSVNPHNDQEMWAASDMSDLFHTTNSGQSWETVPFTSITATPSTLVQYTSDPNIVYTIPRIIYTNSGESTIPQKSTDGGKTWQPVKSNRTFERLYHLFVDDSRVDRLVVADYANIYFSGDGGETFSHAFKTTNDNAAHLGGVFWSGDTILVATPTGIVESLDNGATFNLNETTKPPAGEAIVSFTAAQTNGTLRMFCVTLDDGSVWPGVTGADYANFQGIYRADYGSSPGWEKIGLDISKNKKAFFIAGAKDNIDVAYVAGGSSNSYHVIYKTTDGGDSWENVFFTHNNKNIYTGWSGHRGDTDWWWGEYALGFTVSNSNPDVAMITDLGYVHFTTDGGETWRQAYVDPADQNPMNKPTPKGKTYHGVGLDDTSCWWMTWLDADNIFTSFTDITAVRSQDGGESWSKNYSNLNINTVYMALKHPGTDKLYAATSSVHDIYESTRLTDTYIDKGKGDVRVSSNGGKSWTVMHNFKMPVIWIAFDPMNPNRMYASTVHSSKGGIFRCEDIENDPGVWTQLAAPPRTEGHTFNVHILNDRTIVATYSARMDASGFTPSSGVFVSTDNGATWEDRSHKNMLYWTKDLVIDPADETQSTWYGCVFSGWGGPPNGKGGLYRTTDRGTNWQQILNLDRVASCSIYPKNPNIMFVTTESSGLWVTENLQSTKPDFSLDANYPFSHPNRVFFNPHKKNEIWVTSFGNGMRVGQWDKLAVQEKTVVNPTQFTVSQNYPNPFNSQTRINYYLPDNAHITLTIFNIRGQLVAKLIDKNEKTGEHYITFNAGTKESGVYFYQLKADPQSETERPFIKVKKMLYVK